MPFEIAKLPRGLTGLLSLRDQGQTPKLLADHAVLTVAAEQLYLLDGRELIDVAHQLAPAVGYNSFTNPIVVPNGECWFVWDYFVVGATAAAEAIDIAPAYQPDGLPIGVPLAQYQATSASSEVRVGSSRFWAPPGTTFGFVCRGVTGAPAVDGAAVVTKLRV